MVASNEQAQIKVHMLRKMGNNGEVGQLKLYIFTINRIYTDQVTKIKIP
jgi:hypothetical protein